MSKDRETLREIIERLAELEHDVEAMLKQIEWLKTHEHSLVEAKHSHLIEHDGGRGGPWRNVMRIGPPCQPT